MRFYERQFELYAVLAAPDARPLWEALAWRQVATPLATFLESPRGQAAVRTIQYDEKGKSLSFGRLGWNDKSHAKWNHYANQLDQRLFERVEAWSPSWNQCDRDHLTPDFFFSLANEQALGRPNRKLLFNQRVIVAMASDLGQTRHAQLENVMRHLAGLMPAVIFARKSRPWGFPVGDGSGFTSAIQDMPTVGMLKHGDPHASPLNMQTFAEAWVHALG